MNILVTWGNFGGLEHWFVTDLSLICHWDLWEGEESTVSLTHLERTFSERAFVSMLCVHTYMYSVQERLTWSHMYSVSGATAWYLHDCEQVTKHFRTWKAWWPCGSHTHTHTHTHTQFPTPQALSCELSISVKQIRKHKTRSAIKSTYPRLYSKKSGSVTFHSPQFPWNDPILTITLQ